MKIERVKLRGFRCFGNGGSDLTLEKGITTFVGSNGAGKTATLQALSRIFGISAYERTIKKSDFHLAEQQELASGSELSIDVLLGFPELDDEEEEEDNENQDDEDVDDDEDPGDSVPEFFQQMAASAPNGPLKVRIVLRARWVDGGENYGELIYAEFNNPGIAHECHLSGGDSGGGVFVLEDGLWRLAGINLSVDGPFRKSASDPVFSGSGSDIIYTPQFSSGLGTWQTGGDETVTPINARWERVKVVDTVNVDEQTRRFARLKVALREGCMISARALQERRPAGALARFPAWSDGKTPVGGHRARTG